MTKCRPSGRKMAFPAPASWKYATSDSRFAYVCARAYRTFRGLNHPGGVAPSAWTLLAGKKAGHKSCSDRSAFFRCEIFCKLTRQTRPPSLDYIVFISGMKIEGHGS